MYAWHTYIPYTSEAVQYTLILSGGTSTEPWNKKHDPDHLLANVPFMAVVVDSKGTPQPNIPVTITTDVTAQSGGHLHTDSRPQGKLVASSADPTPVSTANGKATLDGVTDSKGNFWFDFGAEEASGEHILTATCGQCSNSPQTAKVDVKVEGLSQIPDSQFYALTEANGTVIGARPGWHTDNHNMTSGAANALIVLASKYHSAFSSDPVLHLNDASLPWGGVYDICARPGACTSGIHAWTKPHAEHRRGTVVDVRANGADGSIPKKNFVFFTRMLGELHMTYLHEYPGTSNEHYHVRLLGRSE